MALFTPDKIAQQIIDKREANAAVDADIAASNENRARMNEQIAEMSRKEEEQKQIAEMEQRFDRIFGNVGVAVKYMQEQMAGKPVQDRQNANIPFQHNGRDYVFTLYGLGLTDYVESDTGARQGTCFVIYDAADGHVVHGMSLDKGEGEATWTASYLMYEPTIDYRRAGYKELTYRKAEGSNVSYLSAQSCIKALPEAPEIDAIVQACVKDKMPQAPSSALSMKATG